MNRPGAVATSSYCRLLALPRRLASTVTQNPQCQFLVPRVFNRAGCQLARSFFNFTAPPHQTPFTNRLLFGEMPRRFALTYSAGLGSVGHWRMKKLDPSSSDEEASESEGENDENRGEVKKRRRTKSILSDENEAEKENAPKKPPTVKIAGCGFGKHPPGSKASPVQPGAVMKFGEDACFVSSIGKVLVVGVADGVGGWREHGVDPSIFSTSLMQNCMEVAESGQFEPERPDLIVKIAYERMKTNASPRPIGSSTACVLVVSEGILYAANLGDSGFVLCRQGKILARSKEQIHYFNAPFQLCLLPEEMEGQITGHLADGPEQIELQQIELKPGDVIVLGTDGIWDNMHDHQILEALKALDEGTASDSPHSLEEHCRQLVLKAKELADSPRYLSPFSVKARAEGWKRATGGKPDDTTLILLYVVASTEEEEEKGEAEKGEAAKNDENLMMN